MLAQTKRIIATGAASLAGIAVLSGCHLDMWIQPKAKPYYQSDFFRDQQASRPLVTGAVPQGSLRLNDAYHTGYDSATKLTKNIPVQAVESFASPKEMLLRGQERYNVYCQPCHGKLGNGNGMIMQRGTGYWQKVAASYHTKRLREIEDGHIYDVITNGYGVMYGYASRIQDVNDRWAIVAYSRALQRSQLGVPKTGELDEKIKESATEAPTDGTADTRKGEAMKDAGNKYNGEVKSEADPGTKEGGN